ncbi:hypothetical protein Tco_1304913 [Tanacetum coccineum]
MMYERPPTAPFQNPPRNTTFPFQRYTLVFQQHQDEPIYDAWTRFKNLIKSVHHHGLDLWSLTQFFYDHVDDYTRMDLDFAADGNLRELSVANLKAQAKRLIGNEDVWVKMHREVEETLGTPIEVEPLDETQLEDLGLNTCNHDIPLSNREVPSFDEPEPQPNPLPNCLSLDISLGEERDPEPPIKPHSPDSFRIKEVDSLTINTSPSPHVAPSHPKDTYCYYRPCIDDPKNTPHYGLTGLLGKSASLGVKTPLVPKFLGVVAKELGVGTKGYNLEAKKFLASTVSGLMAYFVTILTPDSARSCVMQCTLPVQGMRSIISTSPEGFLPSILLLVVIIVTVVIVVVTGLLLRSLG